MQESHQGSSTGTMASEMKDTTWAMLCHIAALSFCIGFPMGNVVGPLIVWAIKKDTIPLVDNQGREASSGIYFVPLETKDADLVRRVIRMR